MKIVLVYISPNKTTQKISMEISKLFLKDHHEVVDLNIGEKGNRDYKNIDPNIFRDADLIGIGSPVFHMKTLEPLSDLLRYILPEIKLLNTSVKAFIYLTYGGVTTGKAFINTAKLLKQNNIKVIGGFKVRAPHFWHTERFPYEESVKTVNAFYSATSEKNFSVIEWSKAEKMFSYQKPIVKFIYPLTEVIGQFRKRHVRFDNNKCIKCKKCLNECPVNAIEMKNGYPERNNDKCIYCYHCTTICPKGAVIFDVNDIKKMLEKNKRIVGVEHPENEIYC